MSICKRGNVYWYKFMWNWEMIRESTRGESKYLPQYRVSP